ncbi:MAG: hypothetical protein JWP25_3774 [Bradyrhizobium sp.]|jgi:hypothetical protein|nr:hypothetical protein [Bradyrhizobium sp.]
MIASPPMPAPKYCNDGGAAVVVADQNLAQ